MPARPRPPVIKLKEMTSDSPRRIAISNAMATNLQSIGYRGNANDGREAMYGRGVMRSSGTVRSGASSSTNKVRKQKQIKKSAGTKGKTTGPRRRMPKRRGY